MVAADSENRKSLLLSSPSINDVDICRPLSAFQLEETLERVRRHLSFTTVDHGTHHWPSTMQSLQRFLPTVWITIVCLYDCSLHELTSSFINVAAVSVVSSINRFTTTVHWNRITYSYMCLCVQIYIHNKCCYGFMRNRMTRVMPRRQICTQV